MRKNLLGPTIWITDKEDIALFVIKNEQQIDDFIYSFKNIKRFYKETKKKI